MDPLILFQNRLRDYPQNSINISPTQLREWLSTNPALTIDMVLYDIKTNPMYKEAWKFKHLSKIIPVEQLVEHDILPEPYDLHSPHELQMKITISTLLQTHTQIDYQWTYMTQHPNITLEDIQAHPELPWDYTYIMCNPNFEYHHTDIDLFKPYLNENMFYYLSYLATYEQIMQHPNEKWLPVALSSKNIQKEHVAKLLPYFQEKYKDSPAGKPYFLFTPASCNPNLTFDDLIELYGEELPLTHAHSVSSFTFHHFKKYPISTWEKLTFFHPILPLEFIKAYPNEPWIWSAILQNNNTLTYDRFNEFPKKIFPDMSVPVNQWHMRHMLFENKHVSHFDKKCILEDLLKSPIPPKTYNFSNRYLVASPLFLEPTFDEIRTYFAKRRIVRHLVEALSNPQYHQCRKRLLRECTALGIPALAPKHCL